MFSHYYPYKILDPVHGFIRFDAVEKKMIESVPFGRLHYINQLGMTYLVYPGAKHSRFEHSLGVMELSGRIFDALFAECNLIFDHDLDTESLLYWRAIVRMAALCHDLGHLPFSHTAESSLLGAGGHEQKTFELINSELCAPIFREIGEQAQEDLIKIAIGKEKLHAMGLDYEFDPLERLFSQIITDDNFGADRIDYLIRDASYTGVGLGHFDYQQLIDCLRILPSLEDEDELTLGVTGGGIQSVESLWMARYLMYARVYHHSKVGLYNMHMRRFMSEYYADHPLEDLKNYVRQIDSTILNALVISDKPDAQVLLRQREPFVEVALTQDQEEKVLENQTALMEKFHPELMIDCTSFGRSSRHFPVLFEGESLMESTQVSQFLREIPLGQKGVRVYVHADQAQNFSLQL